MGKKDTPAGRADWRYVIGLLLLALGALSILFGVAAVLAGYTREGSAQALIWLLAGPSEVLCLLGVVILGKEKYQKMTRKVRAANRRSASTNRNRKLRYYLGLAGCLFNGIPLTLYAYVLDLMPGGATKVSILVIADLVFFGSLFFAGGEFWEKLRGIFIWEDNRNRRC